MLCICQKVSIVFSVGSELKPSRRRILSYLEDCESISSVRHVKCSFMNFLWDYSSTSGHQEPFHFSKVYFYQRKLSVFIIT